MCPRPKILGCCIPWTKCPLAFLPLTEQSHPFDLIERSDTRLPTATRFSAAKRGSSMCGPSVHPPEADRFHAWRSPGSGHIGQGHNIQGTLCSRGATSKNFRSGTHQPCIIEGFVTIWANWLRNDQKCRPVVPVTIVYLWNQKRDRTIFCFDAVKDYLYTVLNIYSMLWCTIAHNMYCNAKNVPILHNY